MTVFAPTIAKITLEKTIEARQVFFADRPLIVREFLERFENDDVELVNGVVVEKMAAQLDHEAVSAWLTITLGYFARKKGLGVFFASRVAVPIGEDGVRLPDLLFVREHRRPILGRKSLSEAPDCVLEIVSPGDRPSELITLESEYRRIGVEEIVFIDRNKQRVRIARRGADGTYTEEVRTGDEAFALSTVPGANLLVKWLLTDTRPEPHEVVEAWLADLPVPAEDAL
jgi:Uma2 family endonuclease